MADAKVVADACWIGSMQAKLHIPQQPIKQHSDPSKLACLPAEYASKNMTRNGASMGKLYTSSDDLPRVGLANAQPGQA